ncbi:MAG: serine/threonine-protein kinase, partial [bacterium]|nr:serine/threonine-protein kinase [bacterium]
DLKPGNIMVGEDGLVKVLDCGLAKLTEIEPAGAEGPTQTIKAPSSDPHTEEGTILGTVAYMSPEQAEARKLDARSDIFSFGSVLYEMVTGRRPFQGDSKMSTLAAIIKEDPKPAREIAEELPRELERIVNRCLRKDPERRVQYMKDLRVELEELKEESDSGTLAVAPEGVKRERRTVLLPLIGALVLVVIAAAAGWLWFERSRPRAEAPLVAVPLTSYPGNEQTPALSPDGNQVAFSWNGAEQDNYDIYVQVVGAGEPLRLTTDPAYDWAPAWSPDGREILFYRYWREGKVAVLSTPSLKGR